MEIAEFFSGMARLLALAEHLKHGRCGHEYFSFIHLHSKNKLYGNFEVNNHQPNPCGYVGCAMGEMPVVFPRHWKFVDNAANICTILPVEGISTAITPDHDIGAYFGLDLTKNIDVSYFFALFFPNEYIPWNTDKLIPGMATKAQVADNIKDFVLWRTSQYVEEKYTQNADGTTV